MNEHGFANSRFRLSLCQENNSKVKKKKRKKRKKSASKESKESKVSKESAESKESKEPKDGADFRWELHAPRCQENGEADA